MRKAGPLGKWGEIGVEKGRGAESQVQLSTLEETAIEQHQVERRENDL